jgi:peptide/nickel transport system substrate-binding protein
MRARLVLLVALGLASALAPLLAASPRGGGTFLVAEPGRYVDSIDAAIGFTAGDVPLYSATCSGLMRLPDRPLPAGFRPQPDLAAGFPKISADRKTYVFTIRRGLRFSTGAPVTAADVAFTINRVLNPALKSPYSSFYQPIVGAQDVLEGKATAASGIVAGGDTLTIHLTHPVGDFVAGAALGLCVLPAGLPFDPEGVKAPVPSAGPYFISEYVPGQQIVLERNPFYGGPRAHHVERIVFDLTPDENGAIDNVLNGKADYAWVPNLVYATRAPGLARSFGVNKSQFFVKPATFLRMFVLNTAGPLLRNNVPLRRAINEAIDRPALLRAFGGPFFGTLTDQFVPPIVPGYVNAHIYPLYKPDVAKARALARGHTRSGKLVLYTGPTPGHAAQAAVVKQDLKRIGLDVIVKTFPPQVLFQKLGTPGEPFDMGWIGWLSTEPDPRQLSDLFDGTTIGTPTNANWSYFDSPLYNRLLEQASQLTGAARYAAFGRLDVQLARDAAPAVPYGVDNALTLVSARTGCVVVNPYLDLAAVCLKG